MMNWKLLWIKLFGTYEWLGLNMGFWVSMAAVLLIVIIMNLVFWAIRPQKKIIYECSCYTSDPLFMEEISSASCFLLVRVSPLIINLE